MNSSSIVQNWQRFKDHPSYGGAIKAAGLPHRMPSARFLDSYRPYWVKYTRGIIEGCNPQLYAVKRNYCTLRKLFRKLNPSGVTSANFPELFVDWLKLKLREKCGGKQDHERYACENLQCQKCHPRNLFKQDASGIQKWVDEVFEDKSCFGHCNIFSYTGLSNKSLSLFKEFRAKCFFFSPHKSSVNPKWNNPLLLREIFLGGGILNGPVYRRYKFPF